MAGIIIADDHPVVRFAISTALKSAGHIILGEAESGVSLLALLKKFPPDILILDIDMPQIDGFEVLRRLSKSEDHIKIIIFSSTPADQFSDRCARLGAVAYVSKTGELSDLISAVRVVLMGYKLFPVVASSSVDKPGAFSSESDLIHSLSSRELAVLRYLAKGYRIRQISDELMLSSKTISTYKARLIDKLGVGGIVGLIDFARRNSVR